MRREKGGKILHALRDKRHLSIHVIREKTEIFVSRIFCLVGQPKKTRDPGGNST